MVFGRPAAGDAAGAGELTFARTRSAVLCTVQGGLMGLGRIAPLGRRASAAPPPGGMKSNGGGARLQVRQRLVFLRSDKTTPLQYRSSPRRPTMAWRISAASLSPLYAIGLAKNKKAKPVRGLLRELDKPGLRDLRSANSKYVRPHRVAQL